LFCGPHISQLFTVTRPSTMSSAILNVPPEIFFQILGVLEQEKSFSSALNLLNLSLSCRAFHHVIKSYVSGSPASRLDQQVREKWKVAWSGMSLYCRRVANICFLCNLRARHHDGNGELFTGMCLCQACEACRCPKISREIFDEYYEFSSPGDVGKLEWRRWKDKWLCQIDDVRKLIDMEVIKCTRPVDLYSENFLQKLSIFYFEKLDPCTSDDTET
jgi:hypothetical protein